MSTCDVAGLLATGSTPVLRARATVNGHSMWRDAVGRPRGRWGALASVVDAVDSEYVWRNFMHAPVLRGHPAFVCVCVCVSSISSATTPRGRPCAGMSTARPHLATLRAPWAGAVLASGGPWTPWQAMRRPREPMRLNGALRRHRASMPPPCTSGRWQRFSTFGDRIFAACLVGGGILGAHGVRCNWPGDCGLRAAAPPASGASAGTHQPGTWTHAPD